MVSGLTPRDKNKDFKDLQDEVMRLRDSVRFTSPTVNASDSTGFGFGSKTQEIPPISGLFALEPQIIEVGIELAHTAGTGELVTGDLVTTTANGWEGKFVEYVTGNDIAGTIVYTPQNTTVFSDVPQTLSVSGGWSSTYTVGTVKQNILPLQSSSIIVDDINANYEVQTITGTINNGQFLILKPIDTKTLTLKTGGNIDITSDVSVADNEIAILQFHENNITPDPNGNYNVLVSSAGGGTLTTGTAENDHLEWDNTGLKWDAVQALEFGTVTPIADSGFLRFSNDNIMLSQRNVADDGNIELKVDFTDRLDLTESNNGGVTFVIRSQNAVDPDQRFQFDQFSGTGGASIITFPSTLLFSRVGTNTLLLSSTGVSIEDLNLENVTNIEGRDDATPFKIIFDKAEDSDTFISDDSITADRINVTAGGTTFFSWLFDGSKNIFGVPTGVTAELEMSANDILGVDRLRFISVGHTGSPEFVTDGVIYRDAVGGMVFNNNVLDTFFWTLSDVTRMGLNALVANQTDFFIRSDSTDFNSLPVFSIERDNQNPVATQPIGTISWKGNDDLNDPRAYADITAGYEDVLNTQIAGSLTFNVVESVSLVEYMTMNKAKDNQIKMLRDVNMGENLINFNDRTNASVATPAANERAVYYSSDEDAMVAKDSSGVVHNLELDASDWSTFIATQDVDFGGFLTINIGSPVTINDGIMMGGFATSITSAAEEYNGTNWSTISSMGTAVRHQAGGGNSDNAIDIGGQDAGGETAVTEEWNGSAWTLGGNIATAREKLAGGGNRNSAICMGGFISPVTFSSQVEEYNGTTWGAGGAIPGAKRGLGGDGNVLTAIVTGGFLSGTGTLNDVDIYNGTSWTSVAGLLALRASHTMGGNAFDALVTGGQNGSIKNTTETFNGTSWTAGGNLSIPKLFLAGGGNSAEAIAIGGQLDSGAPNETAIVEKYNGTTWSNTGSLVVATKQLTGGVNG